MRRQSWKRAFSVCVLSVLLAMLLVASTYAESVRLGLWTQVWPWMWLDGKDLAVQNKISSADKMRWEFSIENLRRTSSLGATWNLVIVRQGRDGPDDWRRIRAVVEKQKELGLATAFRVIEDPNFYKKVRAGSPEGATQEFSKWIESLAREFSGDVDFYLISNEIDHNFGANLIPRQDFEVDFPEYELLIRAAQEGVKKGNPGAYIVDHGVSSYSLGLAVAKSIWDQHGLSAGFEFWKKFNFNDELRYGTVLKFINILQNEDSIRRIRIAEDTFRSGELCDFHQIHWYFGPEVLPDVIRWIVDVQKGTGVVRPLFLSELGYRMPVVKGKAWDGRAANVADFEKYSEQAHASNLGKALALSVASGIRYIQYWQMRVHHDRDASAQLYHPATDIEDFRPTLAVGTFYMFGKILNDELISSSCAEGLEEFNCELVFADRKYKILWRKQGMVTKSVPSGVAGIYDYAGRELDPVSYFSVGTDPIVMEFVNADAAPKLLSLSIPFATNPRQSRKPAESATDGGAGAQFGRSQAIDHGTSSAPDGPAN